MRNSMKKASLRRARTGAVLVQVAIILPALLGLVGLVIDGGLLMARYRKAQTAADAAAIATAKELLEGRSDATAISVGSSYAIDYNDLPGATVTINIPPSSGPFAGDRAYAEAVVTAPQQTWFIQVLGVNRQQGVQARSVAGSQPVTPSAGVIVLDPAARPGLGVSGGGTLSVNGGVLVNSEGGGVDENGASVNNGSTGYAAAASNNGVFLASDIQVVGGVNTPANFRNIDPGNSDSPLHANALPQLDPLLYLPVPTVANGANPIEYPAVSVSGNQNVTLWPGVYPSISIIGGTVTFEPGIYVIRGGALKITEQNVTAQGVMFYVTGNDYNVLTGLPDALDLDIPPPASGNATFGSVTINAGLKFGAYKNPSSPFDGMLFYQRRRNTQTFNIQGNSASGNLAGTIYAKWAPIKIAGQGTYDAQFVVASLDVTGSGTVRIDYAGKSLGRSSQLFLVE